MGDQDRSRDELDDEREERLRGEQDAAGAAYGDPQDQEAGRSADDNADPFAQERTEGSTGGGEGERRLDSD
jgi:hypothetical protein